MLKQLLCLLSGTDEVITLNEGETSEIIPVQGPRLKNSVVIMLTKGQNTYYACRVVLMELLRLLSGPEAIVKLNEWRKHEIIPVEGPRGDNLVVNMLTQG